MTERGNTVSSLGATTAAEYFRVATTYLEASTTAGCARCWLADGEDFRSTLTEVTDTTSRQKEAPPGTVCAVGGAFASDLFQQYPEGLVSLSVHGEDPLLPLSPSPYVAGSCTS